MSQTLLIVVCLSAFCLLCFAQPQSSPLKYSKLSFYDSEDVKPFHEARGHLIDQYLERGYTIEHTPFHRMLVKDHHTVIIQNDAIAPFEYMFTGLKKNNKVSDEITKGIPVLQASLMPRTPNSFGKWEGGCFTKSSANITRFDDYGATISINIESPASMFCADAYLILTRQSFYIRNFFFRGTHTIDIEGWKEYEHENVLKNGIQIYRLNDGIIGEIASLYKVWRLLNSYAKPATTEANLEFLRENMNLTFAERNIDAIDIDESQIESGDYFAVTDFNVLNPMVMYLTGGRSGHAAVALRMDDGIMYVLEAIGEPNTPDTRVGIIKTPYSQWIQIAKKGWCPPSACMVTLHKLRPDLKAKFNETAARQFFNRYEGYPYGYHNVLFTLVDTPDDNFAPPFNQHLLASLFTLTDGMSEFMSKFYSEGLNKRLGTVGLTMMQLMHELDKRGMSFGEALAIPERDEWEYSNGKNIVCDTLVMYIYKEAGVLGEFSKDIHVSEFTPKDSYQISIFDNDWVKGTPCEVDGMPYCQLIGRLKLELPGFNTIKPYAFMNERCPSMPFEYYRPDNC